jgi:hypothetical protein
MPSKETQKLLRKIERLNARAREQARPNEKFIAAVNKLDRLAGKKGR